STTLCGAHATQWLEEGAISFRLIDAILSAVHPKLYAQASAVIEQLCANEEIMDLHGLINEWPSVFTAITFLQNRESPFHRDPKSIPQGYDVFLSIGSYGEAILELSTLGIRFRNTPGPVVLCSGSFLRQGMSIADDGKRIGYVFHMHPSIFDYALIPQPPWAMYNSLHI
ncbi:hypothetical protein PAXRUDRAFT_178495, partial [Paxillus rubicundulus Ve08.2h10]